MSEIGFRKLSRKIVERYNKAVVEILLGDTVWERNRINAVSTPLISSKFFESKTFFFTKFLETGLFSFRFVSKFSHAIYQTF